MQKLTRLEEWKATTDGAHFVDSHFVLKWHSFLPQQLVYKLGEDTTSY